MSREDVEFVEGLLSAAGQMDKQALLAVLPELIAQAPTGRRLSGMQFNLGNRANREAARRDDRSGARGAP